METNEPVPSGGRACLHCGGAIPNNKRKDAKVCSAACSNARCYTSQKGRDPDGYAEKARNIQQEYRSRSREKMQSGSTVGLLAYKRQMLSAARQRAKQAGVPFNLTTDDIHLPDRCPALGLELKFGVGSSTDSSPSLDRILPQLGYVKGNVMVLSMRANRIKNDATVSELEAITAFFRTHISNAWMKQPPPATPKR